jgi:hypothetical protein
VAQSQDDRTIHCDQDLPWRLGCRICLLKGCQQSFTPQHPLARYCSVACRRAARRWRQQTANRRYRASEQGRCRRREQSCRRRQRVRERPCADSDHVVSASPAHGDCECECDPGEREGYPYPKEGEGFCCGRPGCYVGFVKTARSPFQKFCSIPCRQALRRVLVREQRWRQRLRGTRWSDCRADDFW